MKGWLEALAGRLVLEGRRSLECHWVCEEWACRDQWAPEGLECHW